MAVISFKCPNCDGELIFDPATQKYKCEYCNSLFTQEELDAMKPMQGGEPDKVLLLIHLICSSHHLRYLFM